MTKYCSVPALAVAFALVLSCGAFALQQGEAAPDFKLEDQFGKSWSLSDLKGEVVVVIAANPKSGEAMAPWVDNLKKQFADKIQVLGLMDLKALPGIVRGMAKSRIRKETKEPLMLDFRGDTSKAYAVSDEYPVVVVIDGDAKVLSVEKTKYTDEAFKATSAAIDKALKSE